MHFLGENDDFEFYVIPPKEIKPIKIVIKGLPRCTKPSDIQLDLEELGYTVTSSNQLISKNNSSLLSNSNPSTASRRNQVRLIASYWFLPSFATPISHNDCNTKPCLVPDMERRSLPRFQLPVKSKRSNRLKMKVDFAIRVDEIAKNLRDQHHSTISTFQAYSIAIDEITDIRSIAQLDIFIRGCDVNLKVNAKEELLEVISKPNTTTAADIFDALMEVVKKYKLPLDKLVCLATDGAPTMTGITK
ncbi:general transcription factor II-I repeat domain-containing protein 2 [Trichonephila clavipes]|nr:general transcription factor II-I repeat domain-containing protein 2 [Trichonephila clavipes]